ncbi:MAG: MarR family transcriptional regulator [Ideonella sp.]|jgi:DNA-binding MarR family transcriptional regulator|nr:MarR family transcriptional regulator [Ideonella sp.]MBL0147267.1 MarR family transcriptional regulator [Ideonella sp.]
MAKPAAAEPDALSLGALGGVLGYHLAQAAVFTYGLFERHVGEPFQLRKTEYSMLMLLLANGPLSPKRLAQALALSAPNLTMLLDRLQDRGLLKRERSQTDRRSQNIVLTEQGLKVATEGAAAAGPMERDLAQRLSSAERAMLIELLGKVAGL